MEYYTSSSRDSCLSYCFFISFAWPFCSSFQVSTLPSQSPRDISTLCAHSLLFLTFFLLQHAYDSLFIVYPPTPQRLGSILPSYLIFRLLPISHQMTYLDVVSTHYLLFPYLFSLSSLSSNTTKMFLCSHNILPFNISVNLSKKSEKCWEMLFWSVFFYIIQSVPERGLVWMALSWWTWHPKICDGWKKNKSQISKFVG